MDKLSIIMAAAAHSGITQKEILASFNAVLRVMVEELSKGSCITIRELGSFNIHELKSRNSTNPITGQSIVVPLRRKIKFKPNSKIYKLLNDNIDVQNSAQSQGNDYEENTSNSIKR